MASLARRPRQKDPWLNLEHYETDSAERLLWRPNSSILQQSVLRTPSGMTSRTDSGRRAYFASSQAEPAFDWNRSL